MGDNEIAQNETHDVFESYDLADEDQIISEMSGRVTDKYVYTFKQGSQDVTGLSFAGTNWAVREYAKQGEVIRIVGRPEIILDPTDPDYIIVFVVAQRFAVHKETGKEIPLDSTVGVKRQWKFMEKKKYGENGEVTGRESVVDPFYVEKAVSKALRNGKQALIPTDIVKRMISRALDSKNGKNTAPVQRGGGGGQPRPQSQPQQPHQPPQQPKPPQAAQTPPSQPAAQQTPPTAQAQTQVQAPAQPQAQPQARPMANAIPPAAASVPPAAAPAAQVQEPPAQPAPPAAAQPALAPAPAQPAPAVAQEMPKDVMIQKLDAVLKVVFATQDTAVARHGLKRITGFGSPSDMPAEQIKALGNTLNSVVKKLAKIENNKVIRIADNFLLWEGPQVAAEEEVMF